MKRLLLTLFALLGLLTVAVTVAFIWLLSVEHSIQSERRDSIYASCIDQNHRHDKTINRLEAAGDKANQEFDKTHPNDKAAQAAHDKQTAAGVATFRLILGAATPHQDCLKLADTYVNAH